MASRVLNKLLICLFVLLAAAGCKLISNYEGLMTLKSVGDSQKEIARYLKRQEALFYKLRRDLKRNKLRAGMSKARIISAYGEPVLTKDTRSGSSAGEVLLYRRPTDYFSSDKIYLYFDREERLSYWEYEPFPGKEHNAKAKGGL